MTIQSTVLKKLAQSTFSASKILNQRTLDSTRLMLKRQTSSPPTFKVRCYDCGCKNTNYKEWKVSQPLSSLVVPSVEFTTKIKDVKAVESEDAIFQCVLSTPMNRITWAKQDSSLEDGDKYEITVSEDKLTHTLRVKNCGMEDNGAFYAIAGITSSSASLTVEGWCL